jgi:putative aldouronate transport system permease protein
MSGKLEKDKKRWTGDDSQFTLLALPTAVWYMLFCYLPMFGIIIAFKNYRVSGGFLQSIINSKWIGFQNFQFLFSSRDIWLIIRNTLAYNGVMIVIGTVLTITLALIVSELHNKAAAKVYQTILLKMILRWQRISLMD